MMADLGIADCSRLTEHTGHHGCECGANTPLVQPPMNDTVAVREDAENRRDPDVVAICDELDALRITEVKLRDALARAAAAPVDDRERVPEGWRVEWGEWDGDPIAGSGFTPRLVPLPVQGDEQ